MRAQKTKSISSKLTTIILLTCTLALVLIASVALSLEWISFRRNIRYNISTLAKVISPYTFEELETLQSPAHGLLFYFARSYPVRPGDWAFGVIDLEDEKTEWVERF